MNHKQGEEGQTEVPHPVECRASARWREETGYRPSTTQNRDEPMPASHHAPRGEETEVTSEQHATGEVKARPSKRQRERDGR